jgi:hypothetical protein
MNSTGRRLDLNCSIVNILGISSGAIRAERLFLELQDHEVRGRHRHISKRAWLPSTGTQSTGNQSDNFRLPKAHSSIHALRTIHALCIIRALPSLQSRQDDAEFSPGYLSLTTHGHAYTDLQHLQYTATHRVFGTVEVIMTCNSSTRCDVCFSTDN